VGEKVKDTTQERVLKAAEALNYRPNRVARNLVRGVQDPFVFGVAMPGGSHSLHFEILKGVHTFVIETGLNLQIFNFGMDRETSFKKIIGSNINGLLALDTTFNEAEERALRLARIPIIYLNNHIDGQSSIYINNVLGGEIAADHLINKGAKHVAFVGVDNAHTGQQEQFEGFRNRIIERGGSIDYESYVPLGDVFGYNESKKILTQTEIDGIFFGSDEFAFGAFRVFREAGMGIPIIGYGDLPTSRILSLSSVRQPSHNLGYEGCQILEELLQEDSDHVVMKELQPEYMPRKS
jgi:DNA-binding LacI/PurR family transcriptional regulator